MTPRASILQRLPPVPEGGGAFRSRNGMIVGYYSGRDYVSSSLYWFGDFDPWVDATLRRLAHPGEVALDIGANIGSTTLALAQAVGPRGQVIAFEPSPANADRLRANLSANSLANVDVEMLALSDHASVLTMMEPTGQPGRTRVTDGVGDITVPSQRLDTWFERRPNPGPIAVCKVDVEGHEESVFAGMPATLSSGKIAAFLFERHLPAPVPADALITLLEDYRYQVYRIEKAPLRVRYVDPRRAPRSSPTSDYIALYVDSDAGRRLGF